MFDFSTGNPATVPVATGLSVVDGDIVGVVTMGVAVDVGAGVRVGDGGAAGVVIGAGEDTTGVVGAGVGVGVVFIIGVAIIV